MGLNIRHGEFHDLVGRPVRKNEITFVPARITLTGTCLQSALGLADEVYDLASETKAIVKPGTDAAWVLGRLMRLFDTQRIPEAERDETICFYASFLAVLHDQDHLAIPFECSDYYGKSSLTFSTDNPPDKKTQELIGENFWGLLLDEPTEPNDYQDRMFHTGAGVWVRFGVEDGEPFLVEETSG